MASKDLMFEPHLKVRILGLEARLTFDFGGSSLIKIVGCTCGVTIADL
jgi:hypothetical protein